MNKGKGLLSIAPTKSVDSKGSNPTLKAKILSDKKLNVMVVKLVMAGAWNIKGTMDIKNVRENLLSCIFSRCDDLEKIYSSGP